jgi:hypothetical protein
MLKIVLQVKTKRGKKVKINVFGFDSFEVNQDNQSSGIGDLWLYGDKKVNGAEMNTYVVKAVHKPSVIEVRDTDLKFKYTDDVFKEYAY